MRTGGEGAEHAERGAGDAVHVGQAETDEDDDGEDDGGDDARLVAQRQAEDDVGRRAGAAGVSDGLWDSKKKDRKGVAKSQMVIALQLFAMNWRLLSICSMG